MVLQTFLWAGFRASGCSSSFSAAHASVGEGEESAYGHRDSIGFAKAYVCKPTNDLLQEVEASANAHPP